MRRRVDLGDGVAFETCDPVGSPESQRALEDLARAAARLMTQEDHTVVAETERPEDTARRFARRLVAIEELHAARVRDVDGYQLRWCRECGQNWPCPTVEAAHDDGGGGDS